MSTVISVLIIIVCVLLILIVLIQNSKGGGLSSQFSSSNQVMGVRKTADFLEKATWTLAISLFVLSLLASSYNGKSTTTDEPAAAESVTRKKAGEGITNPEGMQNTNIPAPAPPAQQDSTK